MTCNSTGCQTDDEYCKYPSTRHYDVVAAKVIETYGVLKDCDGTGSVRVYNSLIRNMIFGSTFILTDV